MERRGTLKSWNDDKGFGFIRPEQGGEELFVHISAVHGERRPLVGDRVLFVAGRDAQGRLRAEHVRLDTPLTLDQPAIRQRPARSHSTGKRESGRAGLRGGWLRAMSSSSRSSWRCSPCSVCYRCWAACIGWARRCRWRSMPLPAC